MHCEQVRDRIGMLGDGELSAGECDVVMTHTADCPECARYRDDLTRLRRHLQQVRQAPPAKLAARVSAALAVEAAEGEADTVARPVRPSFHHAVVERIVQGFTPYLQQAAVILLACAITMGGTAWWMQRTSGEAALTRDVLAAHVRSLLQENPVQVASLDTHTVKPWFTGRLEYSPVVKDLSGEGFQLVGGRLDYVDGQRVAALVYKRRLHQISVFVWPSGNRAIGNYSSKLDGFNLLGWSKAGMSYWAVSDLNEGELRELQALP